MHASEMDPAVEAMTALAGPGHKISDAPDHIPSAPGLYAVHAEPDTWRMLGLEGRDPKRPLYVGKSEDDLVTRDLKTHFAIERGQIHDRFVHSPSIVCSPPPGAARTPRSTSE